MLPFAQSNHMLARKLCAVFLTVTWLSWLALTTPAQSGSKDRACDLVEVALELLGGERKLRSLSGIQIERIGHTYSLEQSERPEGPWLVNYEQVTEVRDLRKGRLRRLTQTRSFQTPIFGPAVALKVSGGVAALQIGERSGPATLTDLQEAEEALALAPERVLINALDANDLRLEHPAVLQDVRNEVIAFTWQGVPVRVFLNSLTGMPTAVESKRHLSASLIWGSWGIVTTRTYFSLWTLEPGGVRYPRQWDVERGGLPLRSLTITALNLSPQLEESIFAISSEVKQAFSESARRTTEDIPLGQPNKTPVEIAPGLLQIPGLWNVALVQQPDGIVIIEAPISSGYSAKVLAEAAKRFPGQKIKAVISTSDAWPHTGGIREYVANEIPVFALDLNKPLLNRLISSTRVIPDSLQMRPKKPVLRRVSAKLSLGSGPNRMEIYPIRSESGERMLMIYFPEHEVLYASDLVQQRRDGSFFMPQYLTELVSAVTREKIPVTTVFAMHVGPTPWDALIEAVAKSRQFDHRQP